VTCGSLPPVLIEAGDVIVLARGDQHMMSSEPGLKPVAIRDIQASYTPARIAVLQHGGGGRESRFICGYLH
jgi:AraC family transcriptional regulator, alkane utilization regulator